MIWEICRDEHEPQAPTWTLCPSWTIQITSLCMPTLHLSWSFLMLKSIIKRSVFPGRGHESLSVLIVPRWGHLSLSLTSFMTTSSLSDEFTPTKDVPLTYDPRTMILLLESYNSSRVTVFLTTQTCSSSLTRIRSRYIHHKHLVWSLLLQSYNSSRSTVFLTSQTRSSPLICIRSR